MLAFGSSFRTDCSETTSPPLNRERSSHGVSNRSGAEVAVGVEAGEGEGTAHEMRIMLSVKKEATSLFMKGYPLLLFNSYAAFCKKSNTRCRTCPGVK